VSSRRGGSRPRGHNFSVARVKGPKRGHIVIWVIIALLVVVAGAAASGATPRGRDVLLATQHFMLFYSGVLALIALTAAVGVGVVATDRIVMTPGHRVVAQAVHRAVSFGALAFLITHIVLEILAHRSHVIDAVVPFLAQGRRFYIGLGTVASDLVIVLIITGIARGRFASRRPGTWRAIHAVAYLAWPLSIVHGLLAGRVAHPYVDWSYGACVAAVALALMVRFVATIRSQKEKAPHGLPDYVSSAVQATMPAMAQQETGGWAAIPQARSPGRAMPQVGGPHGAMPQGAMPQRAISQGAMPQGGMPQAGMPQAGMPQAGMPQGAMPQAGMPQGAMPQGGMPQGGMPQAGMPQGAMPQAPRMPRALPPAAADRTPAPNRRRPAAPRPPSVPPQPPAIATRRLATPRPDLPIPQPHQQEMRPWQQREWQEQQQDVTPWQQQEWEQQEWEQQEWEQQEDAQALEPEPVQYWEYPEDPDPDYPEYPAYPAYPGAEGS
jgi:DMSO/TMAO reductase YedYZ heme-binding membrane subunit